MAELKLSVPVGRRDHLQGLDSAPLVLVEYGDYQCPFCARAHGRVKELQREFGDNLLFVFRNFPIVEMHPDALRAAETAEWAGSKNEFWPMHDWLFEHQDELDPQSLLAAAADFELDPGGLQMAWRNQSQLPRIREDVRSANDSGVGGTPSFFIDDFPYEGGLDQLALVLRTVLASGASVRSS